MEALPIPHDEIRSLRISLRRDSNFSFYNPESDAPPHLPDLPSAGESISELDPSPPELRCRHCNGRLLRGLDSIACIFCGRKQVTKDGPHPHRPIKFMATSGSKWLLQSLGLDGSELSGQSMEDQQLNRRPNVARKDIPLSELLDLEIHWPTDSDIGETKDELLEEETAIEKLRTLNFEGLDLSSFSSNESKVEMEPPSGLPKQGLSFFQDPKVESVSASSVDEQLDFFPEPRLESASAASEDRNLPSVSQPFPSTEAQGPTDLSLFESVQPACTSGKDEDEGDDSFAGWEVEFQSADSAAAQHQESKPFDPFEGSFSAVDLSAHLESVFGAGNEAPLGSTSESTINDWFPGDILSTSTNAKDGENMETKTDTFPPMDLDFLEDNQLQTATNTMKAGGDDYFDGWNDFTSSSKQDDSLTVVPPLEKASEMSLFGAIGKSDNVDSGSLSTGFPQSDLFSGMSNDVKHSNEVDIMWAETSASERTDGGIRRSGDGSEEIAAGGDVLPGTNSSSKPELVEKYISQMHDLSFMLENDLPMPHNRDPLTTLSKD